MLTVNSEGVWWLPESPSVKVGGTLHFSDEAGITLSLAGVLGEQGHGIAEKKLPLILGLVWNCPLGQVVTLQSCSATGFSVNSSGFVREDYFADRLFIGAHFQTGEELSFKHMSVALSGLSSWADVMTGLEIRHERGFEVRWRHPEPVSGQVHGGSLVLGAGARFSGTRREYVITEEIRCGVSCNQPQSADELMARYGYPLQNFMTLATDHPNAMTDFRVRKPNSHQDIHVLAGRTFCDAKVAEDLPLYKMLFSLSDVKDRAPELIARWLEISTHLSEVCGLYFGIQYKPDTYMDLQFLAIFQAVELYMRRRFQTPGEAPPRSRALPRGWLTKLLEEHGATVGPLFKADVAQAGDEIMQYRDYIVHRDSSLGRLPGYAENLFWLMQKLKCLMKACFLTELGIAAPDQDKFFRRNQMYVQLLGLANG